MKKIPKQIIITKKGTSSNYTTSDYFDSDTITETTDPTETEITETTETTGPNVKILKKSKSKPKSKSKEDKRFSSIVDTSISYRRPKKGTKQDNYTEDDIIKQLKGFIPLRTMEEKKILTQLPTFKTWIKYINVDSKQFRIGGFLMKVQYPDYITLVNTRTNISWSVQLNNNIIFIRDPRKRDETTENETDTYYETDTYTETETQTTNNEIEMIKDKLYKLYLNGKLTTKK